MNRCLFLCCLLLQFLLSKAQQPIRQFTNYAMGGPHSAAFTTNNFKCIAVGKGNLIWAGTQYGGLYKYNDTFNIWTKSDKLPNVYIYDLKADPDSGIWVAQAGQASVGGNSNIAGGVNYFPVNSDISMEFYSVTGTTTGANLLSRNVRSLYIEPSYKAALGRKPRVWAAMGTYITSFNTRRGGVNIGLNPHIPYFNNVPEGFSSASSATPICEAIGGGKEVWVASRQNLGGSRILRYAPSGAYLGFYNEQNMPAMFINGFAAQAIFFDKFGNRWIGLKDGGLRIRKHDTTWVKMDAPSFFSTGTQINFNAITEDEFGNVYIGTTNGLLEYQSQDYYPLSTPDYTPSYRRYTTADGLPDNNITGLSYDKKNGKVLITTPSGVSFMNRKEPFIKGVVFDVYTSIDSSNNTLGLQKKPLQKGVRATLLKNGVEEEVAFPNAFGIFELKTANETDNYTVEVRYDNGSRPIRYIYNNIRNHTLMEPTLMPDSLIKEIEAFEPKMAKRSFPLKLGFGIEINSELFSVAGFNTTGFNQPIQAFYTPSGISANHQKRVENLANFYAAMATVYKLGGDAVDLNTEGVANLMDAVEALGGFAEAFVNLKKPSNLDQFETVGDEVWTGMLATLKTFKGTLMLGLTKASFLITDEKLKAKYDKYIALIGEVADLLVEAFENGRAGGVQKLFVDNLKKVIAQAAAINEYAKGYASERHAGFVTNRAAAAAALASPYTYVEAFDNLYNPLATSIAKYATDTVTNRKAGIAVAADVAKVADIATEVSDAASFLGLIPGGQGIATVCKGLSFLSKGVKLSALVVATYLGLIGGEEVADLSDEVTPKSGLLRIASSTVSHPAARLQGAGDSLVIRKNNLNTSINTLQAEYAAGAFNPAAYKTKLRQYLIADSLYALELDRTMNRLWSTVDSAYARVPGFRARLNVVVDSFVNGQGATRQALFWRNAGYAATTNKSEFRPGLDSLCNELKRTNDSAVNGIVALLDTVSVRNVPSVAYLAQDGYTITHSRLPGTSGTVTYYFTNYGSVPQTNVRFKMSAPTGGYNITSPDSVNVGTVQPNQRVQVTYAFTAPTWDSIGFYTIDVIANHGIYRDVDGAFYTIDTSKVYTVRNGDWHDPATWSIEAVPTATHKVFIYHKVDVNADASCKQIELYRPGNVVVKPGKKVNLAL